MSSIKDSRPGSRNYRSPPVEHQFKKGTSGNPKGRPKKNAVQPGFGARGGGLEDRLATVALEEATRPVTVREGDKVSEVPAMQALLRTLIRSGAQGDTKAARQVLELIARAETGRTTYAKETLESALSYKEKYGPLFEKHAREGIDPPDVYPHPDDLIVNLYTGEVTIAGPLSLEQAGARRTLQELEEELMARYRELEEALKQDPTNRALRAEFKELAQRREILKDEFERVLRHKVLGLTRNILRPKPRKPKKRAPGSSA